MTNWYVQTFLSQLAEGILWAQQKGAPARNEPPLPWWLPMVVIGVMLYFIMIRPESRRRREHDRLLEGLKQNDRVVTVGGIFGTVVSASKDSDVVVIRVDDTTNTRLRVQRSSIARVESDVKDKKESDK